MSPLTTAPAFQKQPTRRSRPGRGEDRGHHSGNRAPAPTTLTVGISGPGASARREYERLRADHVARVLRDRPFMGPLILRLQCEPQRIRAWEQGASGERIVGARLERIDGIEVLHDRRIPGTRANIDHIAVGPGGVYVIDAKLYTGRVEHRDVGRFLRRDDRLFVGGRDQSKLVAKMAAQVTTIARALGDTPIPVSPALCFVEAQGEANAVPFMLDGVWVGTPEALPALVARPGLLDADAMQTTAGLLDERLPRA